LHLAINSFNDIGKNCFKQSVLKNQSFVLLKRFLSHYWTERITSKRIINH